MGPDQRGGISGGQFDRPVRRRGVRRGHARQRPEPRRRAGPALALAPTGPFPGATHTASIGISGHRPDKPEPDSDQLFREADQALYKAKDSGRNRVAVWTVPDGHPEVHSTA
ncbi:GGDEF domain-containing protein [Thiohalorhabdus sp.]|uniref:GGDEF domain-containing protein n=1 Tax=Thiohalorhabdus sp. TaxID=3094134 RepID=UPI003FCC6A77